MSGNAPAQSIAGPHLAALAQDPTCKPNSNSLLPQAHWRLRDVPDLTTWIFCGQFLSVGIQRGDEKKTGADRWQPVPAT